MPVTTNDELVRVDREGAIRIVRLNRPQQFNALDVPMHNALEAVWDRLADDLEARAVVLTGEGKAFCAGGDLATIDEFAAQHDLRRRTRLRHARRLMDLLLEFPLPLVAAVNGPAVGFGALIATSCDLLVMGESAYLSDPHTRIGLVAGDSGVGIWPGMVGMLKAKEFLLLGERISAAEAVQAGLANRSVPDAEVLSTAMGLAQKLAALPAFAVQETKRALNLHLRRASLTVVEAAISAQSESSRDSEYEEARGRMRKEIAKGSR
jgi:enoyl-CoA hydratase